MLMYLVNLFVSFHYFVVVYINSAFLSKFIDTQTISLLYLVGSVLSVGLFLLFAKIVRRVGNYHLVLIFAVLEILALVGLATAHNLNIVIFSFLLYLVISPIIYLSLDIFLEKLTTEEQVTGSVRGMFLTMQNITQVVSPLLVGLFLLDSAYWRMYSISIGFLLIAVVLIVIAFRRFNDPHYIARTLPQSLAYVLRHSVLRNVFAAQILLRFFYAWMVIYTPLYLSQYIGFTWSQIGVMFSIMLLPFLILELPLGRVADSAFGEKKIMIFGFVLLVAAVVCIPFLTTATFAVWTAVLFTSRIGAACIEMATESYFFRHVNGSLADTISLFRMARPATYVAVSAVAALTLSVISLQWSFLVLAIIMVLGVPLALTLRSA